MTEACSVHFRLRLIALESPGFPALDDHSSHRLDLPDTLTVSDFLKSLQLPEGRYGVLLNGRSLSAGERHRLLRSGDDLVIFPSIKGGQKVETVAHVANLYGAD